MLRVIESKKKIKILSGDPIFRYNTKGNPASYTTVSAPSDLEFTGKEWLNYIKSSTGGRITAYSVSDNEFITFIAPYLLDSSIRNFQILDPYLANYLGFPNRQENSSTTNGYTSETWGYFRLLFEDDGFIGNEYEEEMIEDHESGITMDGKVYQPTVYTEPTIYKIKLWNLDINQTRWAKKFLRTLGSNTDCYFATDEQYPPVFPYDNNTPFQIAAEQKFLEKSERHNSNNITFKMVWAGEDYE